MFDNAFAFGLFLLLAIVVGWFLGVRGWFLARRARREVAELRAALVAAGVPLPGGVGIVAPGMAASAPAPAPVARPWERPAAPPVAAEPVVAPVVAPVGEPEMEPAGAAVWSERAPAEEVPSPAPPPRPARARPGLEEALTQRWGVWLGAVAILLSGVFLVRYAAEQGWLGPAARCVAAAVLGVVLVAGAEWLRRRPARESASALPDLAPAALAAGGVAVLFGAAYGAAVLYALVPAVIGFALLAAAALAGLALALVFGPLVAAVGIVGAYVTPALVGSADPSVPGLFVYLLVVTAAALAVVRQVGAVWLGWAAILAASFWVAVGKSMADGADLWAPALFVPAAAAVHLALLPGAALDGKIGRRLAWVPVAVLGFAGLVLVPGAKVLAPAVGLLLLTPVTVWKGFSEPRMDRLPWLAAAFGWLMLLIWAVPDWKPAGEVVRAEDAVVAILPTGAWLPEALRPFLSLAGILAGMHLLAGLVGERRAAHPVRWAALPAAVPVLVLLLAYARVKGFAQDTGWAFAALALAAGLVGLAALAAKDRTAEARRRAGAHAAGAVAAIALGASMVLTEQWLTLAVAVLLPPLAWIEARTDLPALRRVALAVAAVVLVRLLLNGEVLDYAFGPAPVLNGIWLAYGVPAACFALAAVLFRRRGDDSTVALLEFGASAFVGALAVLLIRHAVTGGDLKSGVWGFREAALDVLALAMVATGLRRLDARLGGRPMLRLAWGLYQAGAVLLGIVLIVRNPAFEVGDVLVPWPVFNEMLLAYALPAALAAAAARQVREPLYRGALGLYALVAAFVWVTLTVRHRFHPVEMSLNLEEVLDSELWSYSGAWLAFGAALLALGIRQGSKALRLASLAVLGLTVGKVFLVDMSELTGLWRVLSFLGLGLALIALGRVYRRFVVSPAPVAPDPEQPEQAPAA
ncbi:DUF2339 domain-containing protein [Muricoccus radiodurans]|uniref:DUF2339 domain-containing protein n=1 Tax=Muricoccus radiodurans TaxID=2231721 RepID=UPI003CEC2F6F